ncbi:MAG TPA: DUF4956 domain-containing protein [Candidatus Paceibacterota bacterium]
MNNFYNLTTTEISAAVVLFNLFFALVLLMLVVYVYKRTHQGLSHSPSFVFTLVIIGLLASVVMMVVQNNLVGAFALLGAFSLIRFRTILKETRDIAFVFFALVIGVAVGTSHYAVAFISTVSISLVIFLLHRFRLGNVANGNGFILTFTANKSVSLDAVRGLLAEKTEVFNFLQAKNYGLDAQMFTFSVKLNDPLDAARLLQTLHATSGVSHASIITGEQSVEY